jgi:hypothetical protein
MKLLNIGFPPTSLLFAPNIPLSTLFQTAAVCVPPLLSNTKLHTHTQLRTKLRFCIHSVYVFQCQTRQHKTLNMC